MEADPRTHSRPGGVLIIDDSGAPKKGEATEGGQEPARRAEIRPRRDAHCRLRVGSVMSFQGTSRFPLLEGPVVSFGKNLRWGLITEDWGAVTMARCGCAVGCAGVGWRHEWWPKPLEDLLADSALVVVAGRMAVVFGGFFSGDRGAGEPPAQRLVRTALECPGMDGHCYGPGAGVHRHRATHRAAAQMAVDSGCCHCATHNSPALLGCLSCLLPGDLCTPMGRWIALSFVFAAER